MPKVLSGSLRHQLRWATRNTATPARTIDTILTVSLTADGFFIPRLYTSNVYITQHLTQHANNTHITPTYNRTHYTTCVHFAMITIQVYAKCVIDKLHFERILGLKVPNIGKYRLFIVIV